jgi:hypothetical protein
MVRQIGLADSLLSQISRVIRWVRADYAEILRVEDLAQMAAGCASGNTLAPSIHKVSLASRALSFG